MDSQQQRLYQQIDLFTSMLADAEGDEAVQLRRQLAGLHAQAADLETSHGPGTSDGWGRPRQELQDEPWQPSEHNDPKRSVSVLAIVSLVAGIGAFLAYDIGIVPIVAAVISIVALITYRPEQQSGRWMAVVGLVFSLIAFVMYLAAYGHIGGPSASSANDVFPLQMGDCFNDPGDAEQVSHVPMVDCAQPHDNEVYAVFNLPDGGYPGTEAVQHAAVDRCVGGRFEAYVGTPYPQSAIYASALWPTEGSWGAGDREVVCLLFDPDRQLTGSQRNSRR